MHSLTSAVVLLSVASAAMAQTGTFYPGVIATGTQGVTNPPEPTMGTAINQTSMSRLISANTIEDFCIFAPPALANISDSETIEVAWCTQQRNDARLIPDGTLTGVSFLQTDNYLQILGYGDFTQLNIPFGDWGGELDPHGAYGSGNPIGGNVTSNISGADEPYAEWMLYIDYDQFCFRVCTAANSTYSAAAMCWHELDEMGCEYVMPGNYNFNGTFETCEADVAYPPGWYPTATVDGTTLFSTFAQYFTGVNPDGSGYTVGTTVTPAAPYMTPSSSNCVTTATVSNGVDLALLGISSTTAAASGSGSGATASVAKATGTAGSTGSTGTTGSAGSTTSGTSSNGASQSSQIYPVVTFISVLSGLAAVLFLH